MIYSLLIEQSSVFVSFGNTLGTISETVDDLSSHPVLTYTGTVNFPDSPAYTTLTDAQTHSQTLNCQLIFDNHNGLNITISGTFSVAVTQGPLEPNASIEADIVLTANTWTTSIS